MILICYDGSADARAAINQAARLLGNQEAIVLTVWEPFTEIIAHTPVGFGLLPIVPDSTEIDEASRAFAEQRAEEGAALARAAGMSVRAHVCPKTATTGRTILAEADKLGVNAIVMGSRGLSGVKSLLLGSVSHDVVQHATITVIVVPSSEVVGARHQALLKARTSSGRARSGGPALIGRAARASH